MAEYRNQDRDRGTPRRQALPRREKDLMMEIFLRNPKAFQAMRSALRPEHFGEYDAVYRLAWQLANNFWDQHQQLPPGDIMVVHFETACEQNPGMLTDAEYEDATRFLREAYGEFQRPPETDEAYAAWAVKAGKAFIDECLVSKALRELQQGDTFPADLPEVFRKLTDAAVAADVVSGSTDANESFPDGWDTSIKLDLWSTGVPFLDDFLNGGQVGGEVYGLLGPTGSAKTTLSAMLAAEAVGQFAAQALNGGPTKLAFVFSYEAPKKELQQRTLGYAARIPRKTMESMESMEKSLSRSTQLKPYEQVKKAFLALAPGQLPQGEYERALPRVAEFKKHLVFIDFSGKELGAAGTGYVEEIERRIALECKRREAICGLVNVDYIGAMASRYRMAKGLKPEHDIGLIGGAPDALRVRIASQFNAPVWCFHQLSGQANKRGELVRSHHSDAKGCSLFAENTDFCGTLGRPGLDGAALIGFDKHRRSAQKPDQIVRIDGEFYRVEAANEMYCRDPQAGRLVLKSDYERVRGSMPESVVADVSNSANLDA